MVNFTALQILFDEDTGEFRVLPQQNVQVRNIDLKCIHTNHT